MTNIRAILKYFGAFILGLTIGIMSEDSLHKLVRQLYESFTYNKIRFDIPKFDLYFFSIPFIITLGIYFIFLIFLFSRISKNKRLINSILTLVFLVSFFLISCYFGANLKLVECTACDDGILILKYSDIGYIKIFSVSLLTSLIPCIWSEIRTGKQTEIKASL